MSIGNKAHTMFVGTIIATALNMTIGIILARFLGPVGMGRIQMPMSLNVILVTLFETGMGLAAIYFINSFKIDQGEVVMTLMAFGIAAGAISCAVMYYLFCYQHQYTGVVSRATAIAFSVGTGLTVLQISLGQLLMAKMKAARFILVNVLSALAMLLFVALLIPLHALTADTALVAAAFCQLIAFGVVMLGLRDCISFGRRPDMHLMWRMLKHGVQMQVVSLMLTLDQNIGLIGIGFLMPGQFAEIGLFSRAVAICGLMRIIPSSVTTLLYSHWCSVDGENRLLQVEKAIRINLLLGCSLLLGIVLTGRYLIIILYGKSFLPALLPLRIIALQQLMWMISKVFQAFFAGAGKPLMTSVSLSAANVVSVACLVLLTPRLGIAGAAAGVTLGQAVYLGMNFLQGKRAFGLRISGAIAVRWSDVRFVVRSLYLREA